MKVQRPKTQSHGIWWAVFCLCPMILEGKHSLHKQWKLPKIMKYLLHTYLLQSTSGQRTHLLKKEFQLCKEEVFFLFIYFSYMNKLYQVLFRFSTWFNWFVVCWFPRCVLKRKLRLFWCYFIFFQKFV